MKNKSLSLTVCLLAFAAYALPAQAADDGGLSSLPIAADGLPGGSDVEEFLSFARNVDLSDGSWSMRDGSGGMSINMEFEGNGKMGDFVSQNADGYGDNNESAHPEGQVISYNLSRIFGYSRYWGRGKWSKISGEAKRELARIARERNARHPFVRTAQARIAITTQEPEVFGSISLYGAAPKKMKAWETDSEANGVFRTDQPFASYIRASGTRPQNRNVDLAGYTVNELETAKTLSTMMLIDALAEQFDRFSGDNIVVIKENGIYHLASYDNNGAGAPGHGTGYVNRYIGGNGRSAWVSRFDRNVALRLLAMDRFVNGSDPRFLGFTDKDAFLKSLGLRSLTRRFKGYLSRAAAHIRTTMQSSGDAAFF
jgi:hypothetical protein